MTARLSPRPAVGQLAPDAVQEVRQGLAGHIHRGGESGASSRSDRPRVNSDCATASSALPGQVFCFSEPQAPRQ